MISSVSFVTNQTTIKANDAGQINRSVAALKLWEYPSNGNRDFTSTQGMESVVRSELIVEPITSRSSHIEGSLLSPTLLILSNFLRHALVAKHLIGVSIVYRNIREKQNVLVAPKEN